MQGHFLGEPAGVSWDTRCSGLSRLLLLPRLGQHQQPFFGFLSWDKAVAKSSEMSYVPSLPRRTSPFFAPRNPKHSFFPGLSTLLPFCQHLSENPRPSFFSHWNETLLSVLNLSSMVVNFTILSMLTCYCVSCLSGTLTPVVGEFQLVPGKRGMEVGKVRRENCWEQSHDSLKGVAVLDRKEWKSHRLQEPCSLPWISDSDLLKGSDTVRTVYLSVDVLTELFYSHISYTEPSKQALLHNLWGPVQDEIIGFLIQKPLRMSSWWLQGLKPSFRPLWA